MQRRLKLGLAIALIIGGTNLHAMEEATKTSISGKKRGVQEDDKNSSKRVAINEEVNTLTSTSTTSGLPIKTVVTAAVSNKWFQSIDELVPLQGPQLDVQRAETATVLSNREDFWGETGGVVNVSTGRITALRSEEEDFFPGQRK